MSSAGIFRWSPAITSKPFPPQPEEEKRAMMTQAQTASDPNKCDMDVYNNGQLVGIFDMPKERAEAYCKDMTEKTGHKHDWYYAGGRVVVKALIPLKTEEAQTDSTETTEQVCDPQIREHGHLVGIFKITAEAAQSYCDLQGQITGNPHDWYSDAGQVIIKSLKPSAPVHEDVARSLTQLVRTVMDAVPALTIAEDAVRKGWKEEALSNISAIRRSLTTALVVKLI